MENALQALLTVLVLVVGTRAVACGWTARRTCALGVALALLALGRTEAAMLGPLVALPLLFGRLGGDRLGGFAARLRAVLLMALPGLLLVGGLCLFYRAHFGAWLPVSGAVKTFYEGEWARQNVAGGTLGSVAGQLKQVAYLALAPLRSAAAWLLASWFSVGTGRFRNLFWALIAVTIALQLLRRLRRDGALEAEPLPGAKFARVLAVYALVHAAVMATLLPHFTAYGTWYFASECVVIWLLLGRSFGVWRGWFRSLPLVLAALVAWASCVSSAQLLGEERVNHFRAAGEWLRDHTEPGARIGAMSAGGVGWYARGRHVHNLDGLINTRQYLDEYLRADRLVDYVDEQGIEWVCDYAPLDGWRGGFSWRGSLPWSRLVPRRYERMDAETSYIVCRVLPPGSSFELLGERGPEARNRVAELEVAHDVFGRFADEALPVDMPDSVAVLRRPNPSPAERGIRSRLEGLRLPQATFLRLGWTEQQVQPDVPMRRDVGGDLRLLGFDVEPLDRPVSDRFLVTIYWLRTGTGPPPELALRTATSQWLPLEEHELGAHNGRFYPVELWPVGLVVPEWVVVERGDDRHWYFGVSVDGEIPASWVYR